MQSENNRTMYTLTAELGGEFIDIVRFDDNTNEYYIWEDVPAVVADNESRRLYVDPLFCSYKRKSYLAIINQYEYVDYDIKFISFQ